MSDQPIIIATRGSALALAQANMILAQSQAAFPQLRFELKIIKTTGDKLQTASLAQEAGNLPKGLFTKELEVALLENSADLAVHSLKDLPTELPSGLKLGGVAKRADVRDVLIYRAAGRRSGESGNTLPAGQPPAALKQRGFPPKLALKDLPHGTVVATSSTRRKAQLLALHPGLNITDIRGNVATRLQKLSDKAELDATVLALAGLTRLNFRISSEGKLEGNAVPEGLLATILETDAMLPCVGQGAIGLEIRANDARVEAVCRGLNDSETFRCVTAERAFLAAMGGGCQSPVGAHAEISNGQLRMRAVSFMNQTVQRAETTASNDDPAEIGRRLAADLKSSPAR